jgi:DNA mismatch endonuclease (patch repair protein)
MMADVHDKATRSKNMRAIATRDTAIEKRMAALLTGAGFTFVARIARCRDAPISPYPTTAALSLLTAVSGITMTVICLRCPPPAPLSGWIKSPATWRDARDRQQLAAQGWRVLIVWECALRGRLKLNDEALTERLEEWICGAGHDAQIDTQGSAN